MITEGRGASYAGGSTGVRAYVVVPDGVARVTFSFPQTDTARSTGPQLSSPLRIAVAAHGHRRGPGTTPVLPGTDPDDLVRRRRPDHQADRQGGRQRDDTAGPASSTHTPDGGFAGGRARSHNPEPSQGDRPHRQTAYGVPDRMAPAPNRRRLPVRPRRTPGRPMLRRQCHPRRPRRRDDRCPRPTLRRIARPLPGQAWCPGTYRVSINILDLEPGHPAVTPVPEPFGSPTFTVRP